MFKFFNLVLGANLLLFSCSQPQQEQDSAEAQVERLNTTASAGDESGQSGEMKAAKEAFEKQYPNAEDVEWTTDANGYFEAGFKMNGEKYRADYTKKGEWIETESSLKFKDLPDAVKKVMKDKFDVDDVTEVERVEHSSRGTFYDVEFKKKGKNYDVEVREDGEIIKQ